MIKLDKNWPKKQADLTVFALDPQGACTPFAPPRYASESNRIESVLPQTWMKLLKM